MRGLVLEAFNAQGERVQSALRAFAESNSRESSGIEGVDAPLSASQLFDVAAETERFINAVLPGVLASMENGFEFGAEEINVEGGFNADDPQARRVIDAINRKMRGVQDTTLTDINETILRSIENNETVTELSSRLQRYFGDTMPGRARTVAQTSTTGAFEAARELRWDTSGRVQEKRWLTQRDGFVRETHTEADGQEVATGRSFTVGGESLRHPGDPNGSAANVINCRCTQLPIIRGDT